MVFCYARRKPNRSSSPGESKDLRAVFLARLLERLTRDSRKICQALIYESLARRPAFNLVLQPQKHRRIFLLLVAVEVKMRKGFGVLVHEEMKVEERLHEHIVARADVNQTVRNSFELLK